MSGCTGAFLGGGDLLVTKPGKDGPECLNLGRFSECSYSQTGRLTHPSTGQKLSSQHIVSVLCNKTRRWVSLQLTWLVKKPEDLGIRERLHACMSSLSEARVGRKPKKAAGCFVRACLSVVATTSKSMNPHHVSIRGTQGTLYHGSVGV